MSPQTYNVRMYPRAEKDLIEIKDYFEQKLKTSPKGLFGKFYEHINILETDPFIYPLLKVSGISTVWHFLPVYRDIGKMGKA